MAQHSTQAAQHKGFPWSHVFGFIMSLVLTFAALYIAKYTSLPFGSIMTVITIMAIIQAVLQLVMFMHLSEGEGLIQKIAIIYSFFIAAVTVIGTVWIFFTM